jgi:catechol 2,3-dioxygenase-like lactoylglutathione lyase family enzyme
MGTFLFAEHSLNESRERATTRHCATMRKPACSPETKNFLIPERPMSSLLSTNHTSFTVRSLNETLPFFTDVLGFEVTSRDTRDPEVIEAITGVRGAQVEIAYLRVHDHTLEMIEYKAPANRAEHVLHPCDVGFAHIAFDVSDIAPVIDRAAGLGIYPISPPVVNTRGGPNQGALVVYLRMADGVTIELIQHPRQASRSRSGCRLTARSCALRLCHVPAKIQISAHQRLPRCRLESQTRTLGIAFSRPLLSARAAIWYSSSVRAISWLTVTTESTPDVV